MKRSAQPLPSGSRTNAGEFSMPRKRISAWKSWLTYWQPWSWRRARPAATSCDCAEALADRPPDRLERPEPVDAATGAGADAPGRAVVDGDGHRVLAFAGHRRGRVGSPHQVDPAGSDPAVVGPRAARRARAGAPGG